MPQSPAADAAVTAADAAVTAADAAVTAADVLFWFPSLCLFTCLFVTYLRVSKVTAPCNGLL